MSIYIDILKRLNENLIFHEKIAMEKISKPESVIILNKLKSILSADPVELGKKYKKVLHKDNDLSLAIGNLKKIQALNSKFDFNRSDPNFYKDLLELFYQLDPLISSEGNNETNAAIFEKRAAIEQLMMALHLKSIVEFLKKYMDMDDELLKMYDPLDTFASEDFACGYMYVYGYLVGRLEELNTYRDGTTKDLIRSLLSGQDVAKRYVGKDKLKKEVKEFAKNYYERGGQDLHNEVADKIYDIFYQRFLEIYPSKHMRKDVVEGNFLTKAVICKLISPIADKYNRVKGKKGVKK